MSITLKQVTAFLAVAEAGNFTLAAERLKMAQPGLSQSIRELEAELGLRLFDRTTRRVELTTAGREFRNASSRIISDLDFAVQNVRDLASRKRGRIVIAAPPLLAANALPAAILEFAALYPDIQVALVDAPTVSIVDAVRSGAADCGVGTFAASENGIDRMVLSRDRLVLFCRDDSPFAALESIRWRDLAGQPLITLTRDSALRRLVEVGFEAAQIALMPIHEVHQIATVLGMVRMGLGLAVLPAYAHSAALAGKVVGRPLGDPEIIRDIVLIQARDRSVSPAVSAFVPVLRKVVRRLIPSTLAV